MGEVVGFIGLGEMGLPMSANLVKAGHMVLGYDVDRNRLSAARELGVKAAASCREVAEMAHRVVITMVRDLKQTEDVLFGAEGITSSGKRGLIVVVMSTLDPQSAARLAGRVADKGLVMIDAPVSGARSGAEAGTLTIMVAGPKQAADEVLPLFRVMGKNIFYLGEQQGNGQAAKLTNNLILAGCMVACAEGLTLARSYGLDTNQVLELLKVSTGNSWVVQNWGLVSSWWERYAPGGTLDIVYKDLHAILDDAAEKRVSLPVTAVVFQRLLHAWEAKGE